MEDLLWRFARVTMLLVLVILISCICPIFLVTGDEVNFQSKLSPRIIGGNFTNIKNHPYMVSIQNRISFYHMCGGTYIAPRFVLSAAHCMVRQLNGTWRTNNPRIYYVIGGATNVFIKGWASLSGQLELVDKVLPYAGYRFTEKYLRDDIGLFRLRRPFCVNKYIQFVVIPSTFIVDLYDMYKHCIAAGWGRIAPGQFVGAGEYLRHVYLPLILPHECQVDAHKETQICAGEPHLDVCHGDSGGPLLCNGTQVGITSWGTGCYVPRKPSVFSRVDSYLEWINETIIRNGASRYLLQRTIISNTAIIFIGFYWVYTDQ